MADNDKMTAKQFAASVKAKFPQYGTIPDDQLVNMVVSRYPQYRDSILDYSNLPTRGVTISARPTGIPRLREDLYTARNRAGNWIRDNMDTIMGTTGGLLGTEGGPPGAIAGAALGGAAGRATRQLLHIKDHPVLSSADAAKDIAIGGLEQGAFELGGAGISRLGKAIFPTPRSAYIAFGARAGELTPQIEKILPDLDRAAAGLNMSPEKVTVGRLPDVVRQAGANLEAEFASAIAPTRNVSLDTTHKVADSIMSRITPNMAKTPENRVMMNYLKHRAAAFSKPWTVGELNAEREMITKRLRSFYSASASGQAATLKTQAQAMADEAEESALKDIIYDWADKSGARPPGYFAALKQKQSALKELVDAADRAKEKLTKESMEQKGAPILSRIHSRMYVHGKPGGVLGISPQMFVDPMAQANRRLAKGFTATSAARQVREAMGLAVRKTAKEEAMTGAPLKALTAPEQRAMEREINALPLRLLFSDFSSPQQGVSK